MKDIKEIYDDIYCGKWEDLTKDVPSNSIDIIITSPPYNVNLGQNKHKKDSYDTYDDDMPYDEYLIWMTKLFTECNRMLKVGGRLCINIGDGANGKVPTHVDFTYILLNLEQEYENRLSYKFPLNDEEFLDFEMTTTIIWDKNQIGASTAWGSWKSPSKPSFPTQFEYIIVVTKGEGNHTSDNGGAPTVSSENFIRNSIALWTFTPETAMMKEYDHPAMFPETLPRRLIDQLTYSGDVVLDPFSGAGTTCATAKKMGRHYIGLEMSEKYTDTSKSRLSSIPEIDIGSGSNLPKWMVK